MNNLFTNKGTASISSSFQSYISGKLQDETNVSRDQKMSLTVAAGVFENQLATIYQNARDGSINGAQFGSLYDLWLTYANGKAQAGDQIISNFTGICFYSTQGLDNSSGNTFTASVNGSGTFPFLSYGLIDNTNWTKTDELSTSSRNYHVYFFKQPNFINILTKDEILKAWSQVTTLPDPVTISSSTILPNKKLIVQIKFGPVAKGSFSNIKLDTAYSFLHLKSTRFIKNIVLDNDPKDVVNNGDGFYTFNIEVTRNEDFIASNSSSVSKTISNTFPIRLYFDNPLNNKYLENVYTNIQLQT
ncbi:hypothetical protein ACRQ5D_21740 [Mucilaginibacter sp. P25]|uniref:Uncharacterized protein n=1 Tax=Mucilaginibacter gossypii TaxID=551996 RepID=A0A1G7YQZ2_9SPHI|nr:hypothetical protein [Mucilaginibacter gossypii]SDG98599.1 hypothetical protein SAMN05192573_10618 [Mucilaginibacter gossypii]